jgi:hypothetical protein
MELHFVEVKQINNGISYTDQTIKCSPFVDCPTTLNEFVENLAPFITDYQSIILQRSDLLRFVDELDIDDKFTAKLLFEKLRRRLRREFDVIRIRFNPRTLVLQDKSYIIHKLQFK